MSGLRKIILVGLLTFPLSAVPENIANHYHKGLEAYRSSQYDLAIQEFESILANNWDSPELYYNLGNAFYRSGITAGAVWAFESSLKLHPANLDAQYNLKLANLKVKDKMDLPEPPLYLKWYLGLKERYTPSGWIHISLFVLILFSLMTTLYKTTSFPVFIHFRGLMLSLFCISLFITLHSIWTDNTVDEGIIYGAKVEVRSEPNLFSTRLFEVHEGLKVSVGHISDEWIAIELLDGKTGWVEIEQIRLIQL